MPAALFACGVNYPSQERAILPAAGTTLHNTPPYTGVPPPVRFTGGFTDVAVKKTVLPTCAYPGGSTAGKPNRRLNRQPTRPPAVQPPVVVLSVKKFYINNLATGLLAIVLSESNSAPIAPRY